MDKMNSDSITPERREMGGNGGAEVKIVFGDGNFSGSVAPERREMDGNGDADVKIELGALIEKLTSTPPSGSVEIPRVPRHKRGTDKGYDPTVVSIGPYHHGNNGLEDIEKIKVEYLRRLASRSDADEKAVIQRYLECVQKREEDARCYYSKEITALSSSQFVEMMVLDGCFILELLITYVFPGFAGGLEELHSTMWFPQQVRSDLLLLENQIPYFILEDLFQLIDIPWIPALGGDGVHEELLLCLAINYITAGNLNSEICCDLIDEKRERYPNVDHPTHLLHLYYLYLSQPAHKPRATMWRFKAFKKKWRLPFIRCLLSPFACFWLCFGRGNGTDATASPWRRDGSTEGLGNVPSAKDLTTALVRFEKKEDTHSFIDVTFQHGTLEIPQISVGGATKAPLQNLIALEQFRPHPVQIFSGYAWLMDNLINTKEDVAILQEARILQTSDKDAAMYFNKVCRGQFLDSDNHRFKDIFSQLNRHAEDPRNRWGGLFRETYISNPWVLITFVAAILLFAMSLLQTIFTIKK